MRVLPIRFARQTSTRTVLLLLCAIGLPQITPVILTAGEQQPTSANIATTDSTAAIPPAARPLSEPVDVEFRSRLDQTSQRYVLMKPAGFDPTVQTDLLIALHGHGSDRWQFVRDPRGECRALRDAAAKHRLLFVSPDYRARTSWMGPAAEADLVQILDELSAQYKLGRVIVSGGSMGGSSALTFAALQPNRVQGVVALNGTANHLEYTQFQDAISASFGGTKIERPLEYKLRSAEYWPEKLTMPVAMTVGGQDRLVPPDSCRRLAGILKQLSRPVLLIDRPQGGHDTNYDDSLAAMEYVVQQLRQPPR